MNVLKKFGLVSMLALSSMSSNAELVSGDWLTQGDGLSILDDVSGKEWLSLTQTDGISIADVQSQLDTTYAGWRLPTRHEVYTMMFNSLPLAGLSYESQLYGSYGSKATEFVNSMGATYGGGYSRGLFLNDEIAEFGGASVLLSGVVYGYGAYSNYSITSDLGYSHHSYGVWLVSDGGTSLSSVNNPNLNINNPDAPINNVSASVPLPATVGILALAMAGMRIRRNK